MKVLIVEDDEQISEFLAAHLREHGFAIDTVATGDAALRASRINSYDLMILDYALPDMTGADVIKALRDRKNTLPVLMLTVVSDPWSKVRPLESGADDYLTKPFLLEELIARMRSLLRRGGALVGDTLRVGTVELRIHQQRATKGGMPLLLTHKEFSILEYLMRNKGTIISKSELLEHVWDSSVNPFSGSVDTHMTNLRKKLGESQLIETIHSKGYIVR